MGKIWRRYLRKFVRLSTILFQIITHQNFQKSFESVFILILKSGQLLNNLLSQNCLNSKDPQLWKKNQVKIICLILFDVESFKVFISETIKNDLSIDYLDYDHSNLVRHQQRDRSVEERQEKSANLYNRHQEFSNFRDNRLLKSYCF